MKTADKPLFHQNQIVLSNYHASQSQVQTILEEMEQNFTTMNDKIMAQIALMDTRLKSSLKCALMTTTFFRVMNIAMSIYIRLDNMEQTVSELILKSGIDPTTL